MGLDPENFQNKGFIFKSLVSTVEMRLFWTGARQSHKRAERMPITQAGKSPIPIMHFLQFFSEKLANFRKTLDKKGGIMYNVSNYFHSPTAMTPAAGDRARVLRGHLFFPPFGVAR